MAGDVIKTASRVFGVLEYLDEVERPVRLSELVARFGYPQSSTAALLKSLVTLGYLHHDRVTRSYTPTTRVALLGAWVQERLFGEEKPIALANALREATGETVVLGIRNDLATQYLLVMLSERPVCYYTKTGALRPLCLSGVGWVLLAAMDDEQVVKLAKRHNLATADRALRVDPAELLARVTRVRRDGYAFSRHTVTRGVGMVAMLLPTEPGRAPRAVGIGGPVDRLDDKRDTILNAMREGIVRHLAPASAPPEVAGSSTIVRNGRKVVPQTSAARRRA